MSKLCDCVEILDSKRIPLSKKERDSLKKIYPYYGAQGIIDYVEEYIFDGEYILVAEDGENLKSRQQSIAIWAEGKFWVNNHAHILGKKKDYSLKYIYYLLSLLDLSGLITGSAQPKLSQQNLSSLDLYLPSIDIQNYVAKFLSNLDSKILNNKKQIETLESLAKTVYDYWFVQFDFPNKEGKPYKSSGGKMVWNEELKREIPEGWNVSILSELCIFKNGINYDKNQDGDDFRIINVRNISSSSLILNEDELDVIKLNKEAAKKYLLKNIDILIARSGIPGAVRLLLNPSDNVVYCGFSICCTPKDESYRHYITYYLKQFEGSTATKTGGSILENVSQNTLGMLKVIIPQQTEIKLFNERISPILALIERIIRENNHLKQIKEFLLPLLMNRQVQIKE